MSIEMETHVGLQTFREAFQYQVQVDTAAVGPRVLPITTTNQVFTLLPFIKIFMKRADDNRNKR